MKKLIIYTILILSFAFSANAQTAAAPAAPPQTADEIKRLQLVGALERAQNEVKASRHFIDALKVQVESKQKLIDALDAKDELAQKAIAGLQSEVVNLRAAITEQEAALKLRSDEVAELKKQLENTRRKLHRARALQKYLIAAAAVAAAALVLK